MEAPGPEWVMQNQNQYIATLIEFWRSGWRRPMLAKLPRKPKSAWRSSKLDCRTSRLDCRRSRLGLLTRRSFFYQSDSIRQSRVLTCPLVS